MKIILLTILLSSCASDGTYNNSAINSGCPIGYHQEYSKSLVVFNNDNDDKKGKSSEGVKCVLDSDQDKFRR